MTKSVQVRFPPIAVISRLLQQHPMKAITLALVMIAALIPQPAVSATKPAKLEGMDYLKARQVILGYGWKPWVGHCEADAKTCTTFPEVDVCSASFPIQCGMRFVRDDWCLMVGTAGEAPPGYEEGGPRVAGVVFRRSRCDRIFGTSPTNLYKEVIRLNTACVKAGGGVSGSPDCDAASVKEEQLERLGYCIDYPNGEKLARCDEVTRRR
jgi:hypothetical protein